MMRKGIKSVLGMMLCNADSLTGADSAIFSQGGEAQRVLKDFVDGDAFNVDFPNNLVEGKVGKNGNVIYAFNATGQTAEVTLRLILGSPDDKYMNAIASQYLLDPAAFVLIDGEFIKRSGDGQGNVNNVIYSLDGGIPRKLPNAKDNPEGDTEQSIAIWTMMFARTDRSIT
jgi:hypothetical protein